MTSQQINRIKKILDIFHLEENLDEELEEVSIKSVEDILDDKNSLTDSPTNAMAAYGLKLKMILKMFLVKVI